MFKHFSAAFEEVNAIGVTGKCLLCGFKLNIYTFRWQPQNTVQLFWGITWQHEQYCLCCMGLGINIYYCVHETLEFLGCNGSHGVLWVLKWEPSFSVVLLRVQQWILVSLTGHQLTPRARWRSPSTPTDAPFQQLCKGPWQQQSCCFCHVGGRVLTLICRVSSTTFRQLACHFSDVSFDNNRLLFLSFVNRILKTWRGSCRSMILLSPSFSASFSALHLISPCSRCMTSSMPQGLSLVVSCPFSSVSRSPDD